jgi:3-hydroxybutyryl-CoA dehydrogenase
MANVEPIEKYGLSKKNQPKTLFSRVGIVGCGTVGQSIARMISCRGIEVTFLEISEEKIQRTYNDIGEELDRQISHWGMTPSDKRAIMSRIKGTIKYEDLNGCDLVIEAILSKNRELSVDIRKAVFKNIERHVDPSTIIATNSTTLVITELSSELEHKERCVSLHFLTTAPDAKILEVVKGLYTTPEVYEDVLKFAKLISKTVIPVEESPGLISVRLYATVVNEACEMLLEGVGTKEDIDLTMKNGLGFTFGPFEMADRIGLDKVERWLENLYHEFGDMKYKASPLIKRLVRANQLGRKTRQGFYEYDENGKRIIDKKY